MSYLEVLRDWNFWETPPSVGVKRSRYLNLLWRWVDLPEVVGLYGVRRSGKTTILLQLVQEIHQKKNVPYRNFLFLNLEDPRLEAGLGPASLFKIYKEYQKELKPKGKTYLFLDEVQSVPSWEKFVLSLYEQKQSVKIFLTGSNSRLTHSSLSSLLSGRILLLPVVPLSFAEFLDFKQKSQSSKAVKRKLLTEYLTYGGFPRVVLEKNKLVKQDLLNSYYHSILEKDIILQHGIRNQVGLKQLALYVLSNPGRLVSTYKLERQLGISNANIGRYLEAFKEAFLVSEVSLFAYSVKKQIYNPSKFYVVDPGLARMAGFSFSDNLGALLENVVYNHLYSQQTQLYYWKNATEVDFLVFQKPKVKQVINVTVTVDEPAVLKRELKSLALAQEEFKLRSSQLKLLTLYNSSGQKHPFIADLLDFLLD